MPRSVQDFARNITGAQVHDLGLDLAVITFVDPELASLATAAILEIAQDSSTFTYDRPIKTQYGGDGIRRHGEQFLYSKECPVQKYEFGKTNVTGTEMNKSMQDLLDAVNMLVPGEEFNAAFIVHYRSMEDEISWHSDHGVGHDSTVGVLAMSIRQSRIFKVRRTKIPESSRFRFTPNTAKRSSCMAKTSRNWPCTLLRVLLFAQATHRKFLVLWAGTALLSEGTRKKNKRWLASASAARTSGPISKVAQVLIFVIGTLIKKIETTCSHG